MTTGSGVWRHLSTLSTIVLGAPFYFTAFLAASIVSGARAGWLSTWRSWKEWTR